jgi:hypothetical protein
MPCHRGLAKRRKERNKKRVMRNEEYEKVKNKIVGERQINTEAFNV